MKIVQSDVASEESRDLLFLLRSEWDDFGGFEEAVYGLDVPQPLVALAGGRAVGGAAFTAFEEPGGDECGNKNDGEPVIWLNALYVVPECRGKGIASGLVTAATEICPVLYALTDVPGLYTRLGWAVCSEGESGFVVCSRHLAANKRGARATRRRA